MLENLFDSIMFLLRVAHPLIASLRFLKRHDEIVIRRLLKYWCLNWVLSFIETLLPFLFNE